MLWRVHQLPRHVVTCRATGGLGVLGSNAGSGEFDAADDHGHIEVACTAHTTTGVRRLVKSVIRGLKVSVNVSRLMSRVFYACVDVFNSLQAGHPVVRASVRPGAGIAGCSAS